MLSKGVRVRGIYSTALTRLLIDNGIKVVDASQTLKERFGEIVDEKGIALATIKDRDDLKGLVVIGERDIVLKILEVLKKTLQSSPCHPMPYELYATYACKVLREGIVELPGGQVGIYEDRARPGDIVIAHVVAYRNRVPVLRKGAAVVGNHARIVEGQAHDVSEHIRDMRRELLLSIAMRAGLEGWGVKWRSSARWSDLNELLEELQNLKDKARSVKEIAQNATEPKKLSPGELLAFIPLSLDDKLLLDNVRARQVPTIRYHHLLKTCGDKYSPLVDFLENSYHCCDMECASENLLKIIETDVSRNKYLKLIHEKIDGTTIVIEGESEVLSTNPFTIKLTRKITGEGVYNGLDIPKEKGDTALSIIVFLSNIIPHAYFNRHGKLKGIYINVNSPVEPHPPNALWYLDACVDVIWREGGEVDVLDLEELRKQSDNLSENTILKYESIAFNTLKMIRENKDDILRDPINTLRKIATSFVSSGLPKKP